MYQQISDKLIIDTIKSYSDLSAQITSNVEAVLNNINSDEELMIVVSMPGKVDENNVESGKFHGRVGKNNEYLR